MVVAHRPTREPRHMYERRQGKSEREVMFYCHAKRRQVTLDLCLLGYMNAHALDVTKSACWRCGQGRRNRSDYAME